MERTTYLGEKLAQEIRICSWREDFPDTQGVAVIFDIFRCTTTMHCIASRKPNDLLVAPSLEALGDSAQHAAVFSELSKPIPCKSRFDNSPYSALNESYSLQHPIYVATTSGTPALFQSRIFERVYAGSLVAFSALLKHLGDYEGKITLIPAAHKNSGHVEDEFVAQAMANALSGYTDQREFVNACAQEAIEKIKSSGRIEHLSAKIPTGSEDTRISLELDRYPFYLSVDFRDRENKILATVLKHEA